MSLRSPFHGADPSDPSPPAHPREPSFEQGVRSGRLGRPAPPAAALVGLRCRPFGRTRNVNVNAAAHPTPRGVTRFPARPPFQRPARFPKAQPGRGTRPPGPRPATGGPTATRAWRWHSRPAPPLPGQHLRGFNFPLQYAGIQTGAHTTSGIPKRSAERKPPHLRRSTAQG